VRLLVLRSLEDRTEAPTEGAAASPRAAVTLPAARKLRLAAEVPAAEPGRIPDVGRRQHFPVPAGPLPAIPTQQHSG
jgi:hypothetical protein